MSTCSVKPYFVKALSNCVLTTSPWSEAIRVLLEYSLPFGLSVHSLLLPVRFCHARSGFRAVVSCRWAWVFLPFVSVWGFPHPSCLPESLAALGYWWLLYQCLPLLYLDWFGWYVELTIVSWRSYESSTTATLLNLRKSPSFLARKILWRRFLTALLTFLQLTWFQFSSRFFSPFVVIADTI